MLVAEFQRILQLGNRNMLLLGVFFAIALGVRAPLSQYILHHFDFTAPLVALIFTAQGLNMDFSQADKIRDYIKIFIAAVIIAIIAYPALAYGFADFFELPKDYTLGFILICCFPTSLEAAMAMTMSAEGNRVTAVVLLVGLSLAGIISIPLNIYIWLGGTAKISSIAILTKVGTYVFLPIITGQLLRKIFPALPHKAKTLSHYIPIICISVLVYISCSREAAIIHSIPLGQIVHILFPSALLHFLMLIMAFSAGRYLLRLTKADSRSFIFIVSEKPMSLSIALWSVTYASEHPISIFSILIFYVTQMIIDSFIISRLRLQNISEEKRSAV